MSASAREPGWVQRRRVIRGACLSVCAAVLLAVPPAVQAAPLETERKVKNRPIEVPKDGFVTSRTCRACHPRQYETWQQSYHRRMTQLVTPDTVATEIDGATMSHEDRTYRFERRGDEYWVSIDAPDPRNPGERAHLSSQVVMSTGSHAMQLYWIGVPGDRRVGMVPFHYLIDDDRWIHRNTAFLFPPGGSDAPPTWNNRCMFCHATRSRTRERKSGKMDTHVGEFGIGCESCHGPGEEHVSANRDPSRRYLAHLSDEPDPTIVNPSDLSQLRSAEVCGQCHGYAVQTGSATAFNREGPSYRPGDVLADTKRLLLGRNYAADYAWASQLAMASAESGEDPHIGLTDFDNMFWPDGMVRGSGRELGAVLESPCAMRGPMTCLSCHTMHPPADDPRPLEQWANDQLKLGMDGNDACLQCHPQFTDALSEHTRHAPGSSGSNCYNCHMPHTTYGLLKGIRSHQIDSPSVAMSVATGRPNACNQCHLDKTLQWTAEQLAEWNGTPIPVLSRDEKSVAASVLWALRGDAAQRVLMAWSFGWEDALAVSRSEWTAPFLAQLLEDPYPAVRYVAGRTLGRLPGYGDFEYQFTTSDEELRAARDRVMTRWKRNRTSLGNVDARQAVLIDAEGRLLEEEFARLLAERNDRPVTVAE